MTIRAELDFVITDVFTEVAGGGNPLAVVLDADSLDTAAMQRIAREFNFSETTFVVSPTRDDCIHRVRIFTPTREVPFAGHPNIGTACVLAELGRLDSASVVFDELAGPVPIELRSNGAARLLAPGSLERGEALAPALLAQTLGLPTEAVVTKTHAPCEASVGLPFTMVELTDRATLSHASIDPSALNRAVQAGINPDIHCYVRDGQSLSARMFAPMDGVPEDPATGSANCALVGLLADIDTRDDLALDWQVEQGVDMGRPSRLLLTTEKRDGVVVAVHLEGHSRHFARGRLMID